MVTDIRLVQRYFLSVNKQQVQEAFTTLEQAQEAAKAHIPSKAELQIKLWSIPVRTWNYRYDVKDWREMA